MTWKTRCKKTLFPVLLGMTLFCQPKISTVNVYAEETEVKESTDVQEKTVSEKDTENKDEIQKEALEENQEKEAGKELEPDEAEQNESETDDDDSNDSDSGDNVEDSFNLKNALINLGIQLVCGFILFAVPVLVVIKIRKEQ